MPQSLAKVYVHIVFSTKNGHPFITEKYRKNLHSYIVGILSKNGSFTEEVYANSDHIHLLCTLPRTITLADIVLKIKASSSKWLKTEGISKFQWQNGYAVFSVSASKVTTVKNYIRNQPEHHKKTKFKDELRAFFDKYDIDYDERYVWD
ncbi:MAG: IS200/IS605 family transposase [Bacteroidota bacterium]